MGSRLEPRPLCIPTPGWGRKLRAGSPTRTIDTASRRHRPSAWALRTLKIGLALAALALPGSVAQTSFAVFPENAPAVEMKTAPNWSPTQLSPRFVVTPAGCPDTTTAEGLNHFLTNPVGPLKGFDSPRAVPLPDGRTLWMVQDAFLDYDTTPSSMVEMRYINALVLVQDAAGCFTAVAHGDRRHALSFEPGDGAPDPWKRFWWPGGASAASGQLQIIWIEMTHDSTEGRGPLDGPAVHPIATWLATYDLTSLQRLSFVPAPEPDVRPIVAFDAVDDPRSGYTYLFGNTFVQNLALEPVPLFGAHSATITTLGRVPLGRLDLPAEYWAGDHWTADAAGAVPIAAQGSREHIMHPQLIDGVWWSTTKPEGFLGDTIIVETAVAPQGPWVVYGTASSAPHGDPTGLVTYSPVLAPWLDPSGSPIVLLSQIDPDWYRHDGGDPVRYRPQAILVRPTPAVQ